VEKKFFGVVKLLIESGANINVLSRVRYVHVLCCMLFIISYTVVCIFIILFFFSIIYLFFIVFYMAVLFLFCFVIYACISYLM
jgi:hypothetical protein